MGEESDSNVSQEGRLSEPASDTEDNRSELRFDEVVESDAEKLKKKLIEKTLEEEGLTLQKLRHLAIDEFGIVDDNLRRKIWPLLLEVDPNDAEYVPSLDELSLHSEYNQVVLDVNRSLKRFPPGIPYNQRLALQDQLTVLILRVIMKYPHLRYYQGYHDVAITFLLVVGESVSFRIMEKLSIEHLRECMEPTMEMTSYRLNYIYSILLRTDKELHDVMDSAMLGTMFALPWYLTWFGHSLNRYKDVVRLYDFFLATPPLMPIYVAASLVMERRNEVLDIGSDMAMLHCLLSIIPDGLDFESVLRRARILYNKHPPAVIEQEVRIRLKREMERHQREEKRMRNRVNRNKSRWVRIDKYIPGWLLLHYRNKYGILFATATLLFGLYAYFRATENNLSLFRTPWNS